jgi:hypothetical protein
MKKMFNVFMSLFVVAMVFSCGDASEDAGETKASGEWDKLAQEAGLSAADVAKAVEIGTKMQACWVAESAPGAYDSHMTDDCDPFMEEYGTYCSQTFGTDDYNDEGDAGKKVQGFREIMFATRKK